MYVADSGSSRISEFAADGSFIRAFGWGVDTGAAAFQVCTTASTCQPGSSGGGAGELAGPAGLAIDSSGNLYVAEGGNSRISVFNTAGPSFTRAFGWGVDTGSPQFETCTTASTCESGRFGDGAGQLSLPFGIALDGAGGLYVAEQLNNRISVFDTAGPSFTRAFGWDVDGGVGFETCTTASTCQIGNSGGGAGQLDTPFGVALDGVGSLYVGDAFNNRISVFNTAGPSFTRAFGFGVDTGGPVFETCTTASICQAGSAGGDAGQLNAPSGVALNGGSLYVAEQGNNRISVFDTAGPSLTRAFGWGVATGAGAFETCTTNSACMAGTSGSGTGELNGPELVATDCRGAVWVADSSNDRVQRFGEPNTPLPPCVSTPPAGGGSTSPAAGPTGRRAAALKKCKKKHGKARAKCKKKANLLPV